MPSTLIATGISLTIMGLVFITEITSLFVALPAVFLKIVVLLSIFYLTMNIVRLNFVCEANKKNSITTRKITKWFLFISLLLCFVIIGIEFVQHLYFNESRIIEHGILITIGLYICVGIILEARRDLC